MTEAPPTDEASPLWRLDESNPKYGKLVTHVLNHMRQAAYDRDDVVQFLTFAAPLARQSHSQLFQELWALWMNGGRRGGYFVEFGAADGMNLSNTFFLETVMGWKGIVAEPHPELVERVRQARSCHVSDKCVYSRTGETMAFRMVDRFELSRLEAIDPGDGHEAAARKAYRTAEVKTISLHDLLESYGAPHRIDYLSIDTEGSEVEILAAFDFSKWDLRTVTVEHNGTIAEKRLNKLFRRNGYRRMWRDISRYDAWYVKDDGRV
jgi:FkbM family methyltransferase